MKPETLRGRNALTTDWRCQDLYRKLTGIAVKLLHQGHSKEAVRQTVYEELEGLGYRTEWPEWALPPALVEWLEEEQWVRHDSFGGVGSSESGAWSGEPAGGELAEGAESGSTGAANKKPVRVWVVNERGKLVPATVHDYRFVSSATAVLTAGFTCHESEADRPP